VFDYVQSAIGSAEIYNDIKDAEKQYENCNYLGCSGNGSAPFSLAYSQDSGNKSAGVTDTNKEDEISYIDSPENGTIHPGHPEAGVYLVVPGPDREGGQREEDSDANIEPSASLQYRSENLLLIYRITGF